MFMAQLRMRNAEVSDVDAIVRLVNRAFVAESPYVEGERINADGVHAMWPRGTFLLGEVDGMLTACIFVEGRGERAHLGLVSVEPAQQGKGIGSQLMEAVEAHCRAAGFREMELRFINHRTELDRFYRRMGFAPSGVVEQPGTYRIKVPFHFVQMIKPL
jgi:GNAT superfamily N-acetyltransferase